MADSGDMTSEEARKPISAKEMKELIRSVRPEEKVGHKYKPRTIPAGAQPTAFFINRDFSEFNSMNKSDEVYPGIYLGGEAVARDHGELRKLGVTHVLNAAQGQKFAQIDTNAAYYKHDTWNIEFMGVQASDVPNYQLYRHFEMAAEFIHLALESGGKVYVHCFQGVSRSASLVLAYLMLVKKLPLPDGIRIIRKNRAIFPNDGFLKQLCQLNNELFVKESDDAGAKV